MQYRAKEGDSIGLENIGNGRDVFTEQSHCLNQQGGSFRQKVNRCEVRDMEYDFYANGNRICPKCGGAMRFTEQGTYRCHDCKSEFDIMGFGVTDKDLRIEEIEHESTV